MMALGGRRLRAAVLAVLVALSSWVLAACDGNGPDSLSLHPDSVSACYRGLPAARAALHEDSAKLRGVHRVLYDTLHREFPNIVMPAGDNDTEVCAFAFTGQFQPGQVTGAPPNARGTAAVVLVSSKKLLLVASWVGPQMPAHLTAKSRA